MTNWVCEVHNDDPSDTGPRDLLERLRDPRLILKHHDRNLGAVGTFNLFYRPTTEPFYAILEDDNWWEPSFLEEMLAAMAGRPQAVLAWCNQAIWEERPDGSWRDTGRLVNPAEADAQPRLVEWGSPAQALGARHANGAMLLRSRPGEVFPTPEIPQAGIEPFRERLFAHPLLYVPRALACFSVTRTTSRNEDRADWSSYQIALLGTFVRNSGLDGEGLRALWRHYETGNPPPTNVFLLSAFVWKESRPFLRFAGMREWMRLMRHVAGRPLVAWQSLRTRARRREWCEALDLATAARFHERRAG
jgi:hypothetical protein